MKLFVCVWFVLSFYGSSFAAWNDITPGPTLAADIQAFENLDYSVAFMLTAENYANQQLTVSQSIVESGVRVDRAKNIGPGMSEVMSVRKPWMTATGCHGVVSWKIGSTGKMLVVMYDLPYDTLWYSNMFAVGIFPQGDITGHYDMMYSGSWEEHGFHRWVFGDIRYNQDSHYYVEASMGSGSKTSGSVNIYPKNPDNLANDDEDNSYLATLRDMKKGSGW